jgi:hypothetical protein
MAAVLGYISPDALSKEARAKDSQRVLLQLPRTLTKPAPIRRGR